MVTCERCGAVLASMVASAALLVTQALVTTGAQTRSGNQPNPPTWPATVHVFGPDSAIEEINRTVQGLYADQDLYQDRHSALLFKPGQYNVDVPVGYYTSVHGLGASPSEVRFVGPAGVHQAAPGRNLIQFWRSAENLHNAQEHCLSSGR